MKFNKDLTVKYFEKFYREVLKTQFKESHRKNLIFLLSKAESEPTLNDIRNLSYILATVLHETAFTMAPIEEYPAKPGTTVYNLQKKYFPEWKGRGFCQLTHRINYQRMSKYVGVDLVKNPKQALEPNVAWSIMYIGMTKGLFTGKKLSDYIYGNTKQYKSARAVVNGTDKAEKIAYYAECIESILKIAIVEENVWTIEVPKIENNEVQKPVTEVAVPVQPEQVQQPAKVDYIEPVLPRITSGLKSWKTAISGVLGSTGLGAAYTWLAEKYQSINNISGIVITVLLVAAAFGIVYFIMRERAKDRREQRAHELTLEQMRIRANPDLTNVEIKNQNDL